MKILAANPDGLGDLILRQPLYSALLGEGHELLLTVRKQWMEIAANIIPGARFVFIELEPYTLALTNQWDNLQPLLETIKEFAPDVFVVTPFRWTLLEEWLAAHLADCRVLGMTGGVFPGDPRWGFKSESQIKFAAQAEVIEESTELAKNEMLASLILDRQAQLKNPQINFPSDALSEAKAELGKIGLNAGEYWIACVGHEPYKAVRNWKLDHWATVLNHWALCHQRKFLLLGNAVELESTQVVRSLMSAAGAEYAVVHCKDMPLRTLGGLIQLSNGYVGRDTGPMHLAAATGKPVIAVFGGGHWPRFQPAAFPSWIGTVQVPCVGCDWQCAFEKSYCISEVPVGEVVKVVEDFEAGRLTTRVVRNFRPDPQLYQLMLSQVTKKRSEDFLQFAAGRFLESEAREREWNQKFQQLEAGVSVQPPSKPQRVVEDSAPLGLPMRLPWQSRTNLESQLLELRRDLEEMQTTIDGQNQLVEDIRVEHESDLSKISAAGTNEPLKRETPDASLSWPNVAPPRQPLPATLPGGKPWPKITVVTPSFNQGRFIEQTILSILNQNYPNLEYIIMDGGSQDETMSVVDRYRDRIHFVVSERDRGQSHAINKGLAMATGDLVTWLNSDDMFEPGALAAMAMAFHTSKADVVVGICNIHTDGPILNRHLTGCASGPLPLAKLLNVERWIRGQFFYQPEAMFTRQLWERAGGKVEESLNFAMDCDLWFRFANLGAQMHVVGRPICRFRMHPNQKTSHVANFRPELEAVCERFRDETGAMDTLQVPLTLPRQHMRVVLLDGDGEESSIYAGMSMAGHYVRCISIVDKSAETVPTEKIVSEIETFNPDLIVIGNGYGGSFKAELEKIVKDRWPIVDRGGDSSVSLAVFSPRDKSVCRNRFGLPLDRTIILLAAAGIHDPSAQPTPMPAALDSLKLKDLLVVCIGQFDGSSQNQNLRVWHLADSQNIYERAMAIGAADIVLDSGGMISLEAAACGRPVVCLQNLPTTANGIGGFVATDTASAASRLQSLCDDPILRNKMGAWARIWVENEFSPAAEFHRLFCRLDDSGLIDRLRLPPKISFQREECESTAMDLPQRGGVTDLAMASRIAALQSERDSLRGALDGVTQTRLWRMVGVLYPMYQRILGNRSFPKFARNGIQRIGNWFAAKSKAQA